MSGTNSGLMHEPSLEHLPKNITRILEFNGHIEVERPSISRRGKTGMETPRIPIRESRSILGCRVIGNDATGNSIESIIDATIRVIHLVVARANLHVFMREGQANGHCISHCTCVRHWKMLVDGTNRFLTSQDSGSSVRLLKAGYVLCRTQLASLRKCDAEHRSSHGF